MASRKRHSVKYKQHRHHEQAYLISAGWWQHVVAVSAWQKQMVARIAANAAKKKKGIGSISHHRKHNGGVAITKAISASK